MNTKIDEKTKIQKSYSISFVGIQYSMCMKTMLHYQSCGSAFIFAVFFIYAEPEPDPDPA